MLLLRAMEKREAVSCRSRFLPMDATYPALARWIATRRSSCLVTTRPIRPTGARAPRRGMSGRKFRLH
jgi:hypothetical protein